MTKMNKVHTPAMLETVFERSFAGPVVLFKHSNRCGISSHVLEMMGDLENELNVIVVQESRELSSTVAERTGYVHQSPQAFVLLDGKPIYHATHYAIDPSRINAVLSMSKGKEAAT